MLGFIIISGHHVGGASGFFLWFFDAILVTYPILFLLSTTLWGTLITFIGLKLSKNKQSFIKHWLLMMISIHWFTIVLLMIDTFNSFNEY